MVEVLGQLGKLSIFTLYLHIPILWYLNKPYCYKHKTRIKDNVPVALYGKCVSSQARKSAVYSLMWKEVFAILGFCSQKHWFKSGYVSLVDVYFDKSFMLHF